MAISGSIVKPGDVINVTYAGSVQSWVVPMDGLYMLEVWGAKGGDYIWYAPSTGGWGGYSIGYKVLTAGTVLYIATGQSGWATDTNMGHSGAFNGGGPGRAGVNGNMQYPHTLGGGATHIALVTGVLSTLSGQKDKILIVAGGGGGGASDRQSGCSYANPGGSGGGMSGGSCKDGSYNSFNGGTQAEAGINGSFGKGAGGNYAPYSGTGGGGYYGGGARGQASAGSGGSGYIGGVPAIVFNDITYSPATYNGYNGGNGYARITFVDLPKPKHNAHCGDIPVRFSLGDEEIELLL